MKARPHGMALALAAGAFWLAVTARPSRPSRSPDALAASPPPNMAYVSAGGFLMGSSEPEADEDVRPARRVYVGDFYLDRTEVTNAEYGRFKPSHRFPPGEEMLPVTNVTYDEAAAYARWAGKRLPTEEEWEKAARGADGRRYPWGNDWRPDRVAKRAQRPRPKSAAAQGSGCASGPSRVQPVGSVPAGASPYGCLDMAGNAWEWVQGHYQGNQAQRILRGGAVGYGERACRTYYRGVEGSGST